MWKTTCDECGWNSGERFLKEGAEVLGELHEIDHPGHTVTLTEIGGLGTSEPTESIGQAS